MFRILPLIFSRTTAGKNALLSLLACVFLFGFANKVCAQSDFTDFESKFLINREEAITVSIYGLPEGFMDAILSIDKFSFFNPRSLQEGFDEVDLWLFAVSDWDGLQELQRRFPDFPLFLFDRPKKVETVRITSDVTVRGGETGVKPVRFEVMNIGRFGQGSNLAACVAEYYYGSLLSDLSRGAVSTDASDGCFPKKSGGVGVSDPAE